MENSNNTSKVIGALVIGAITGVALGILFAPRKGSKTRKKIVDNAEDIASDLRDKVKDEVAILKQKAAKLEEYAEEKLENLKKSIEQKVNEFQKEEESHHNN